MATPTLSPRALFQTLDARPEGLAQAQSELQSLLHGLHASLQRQRLDSASTSSDLSDGADGVWESASPTARSEPPTSAHDGDAELFAETRDALVHWLAQRKQPPLALWLLCMEIGACVLASSLPPAAASDKLQLLLKNTSAPIDFPSSSAHCDAKQQLAFSCSVWDALVTRALSLVSSSSAHVSEKKRSVLSQLLDVFVHWMKAATRGHEVAFISNVGVSLIAHITQSMVTAANGTHTQQISQVVLGVLKQSTMAPKWQVNAPEIALAVLVLHAVANGPPPPAAVVSESERELEKLRQLVVSSFKSDPFPHVHDPHSIIAMALGIIVSSSNNQQASWASVLMQQFALLRSVNLPLLSFRLGASPSTNFDNQQEPISQALQQSLANVVRANFDSGMVALSFQMLEKCAVEASAFFRSSLSPSYASLVKALQSVYPTGLLRKNMIVYTDCKTTETADAAAVILGYLKVLYHAVSSTLQVLTVNQPGNVNALLLAFLTLSKLEFARESCASQETDAFMNSLTQQIEDVIELGSSTHVLSTILRSVLTGEKSSSSKSDDVFGAWSSEPTSTSSSTLSSRTAPATESVVPLDVDVIYSAQTLVVGVILQRKLRVLLFQSSALVDEALALVFSGLYSGYEPLNLLAHNFLSFCLTHLGQYVSTYNIAPYYLQVTLAKYPANVEEGTLAKTCGVIFGALFYAGSALAESNNGSTSMVVTQQQRMVLWAMKQCCDRVAELVLAPKEQDTDGDGLKSGLYLAGIIFEVMKMGPIDLLVLNAMEIELMLSKCAAAEENNAALHALKTQLFTSISQNCDAEKRAWLAAWYVELANVYPTLEEEKEETKDRQEQADSSDKETTAVAQSRL